jgi:hypothetical protein
MTALPVDNTPRFRVTYTNLGLSHVLDIRSNSSPSALGVQIDAFFDAISGVIADTSIDVVEYAPSGSSVFNPVTTGIETNHYGTYSSPAEAKAWYVGFVGRSSGGHRARLFVFGAGLLGTNYRWAPGENTAVDSAVATLQAQSPGWQAIDGLVPTWKSYANAGVNDALVKKLR